MEAVLRDISIRSHKIFPKKKKSTDSKEWAEFVSCKQTITIKNFAMSLILEKPMSPLNGYKCEIGSLRSNPTRVLHLGSASL